MWFYEYRNLGRWAPAIVPERPEVTRIAGKMRLKCAVGVGQEVRATPCKVHPAHHVLTLGALADLYGEDGRFRATTR